MAASRATSRISYSVTGPRGCYTKDVDYDRAVFEWNNSVWSHCTKAHVSGGLLILFAGIFDMFDGAMARVQNAATSFGAFLDSVLDRY
jgi:phosphatidylglycerophosphate synthase